MYCQECKDKFATVHLTQVYEGNKVELHLCADCAMQKGVHIFEAGNNFSLPSLLGGVLGNYFLPPGQGVDEPAPVSAVCPRCKMNFSDISHTGKLGCADCYKAFDRELEPILRRIHGHSRHVGKIPLRTGDKVRLKHQVDKLKLQLHEAVTDEQYEAAAEIRDKIKELEKKMV